MLKEYIAIFRARRKISGIENQLEDESSNLIGKPFRHETTLIKIALIAPAALYYSLPKKERREALFDAYLRLMASGLYSGDLEDYISDSDLSKNERESITQIQEHFIKEAHRITKNHKQDIAFHNAETDSRAYQDQEGILTAMLDKKDLSFVEHHFDTDPTLENLTYDRIAVLYTFGVKAAFDMFLRGTRADNYEDDICTWAKYLPIALQESYDDINDLEEDLTDNRPTPLILRGIRAKQLKEEELIWPLSEDKDLIKYGLEATKSQTKIYFQKIESLTLPPVLNIITQKVKEKIPWHE